ncbi:MAG TPA: T9SS type B sorting domain-containing protein [Bacteroidetes bacterium]|nr:T9SS type B sorting domain-containing protein [Bacteroidota bacterium]
MTVYRFILLPFLLFLSAKPPGDLPPPPALMGIQTSTNFSSEQLVKDIFLKDGCKNAFNIRSINNGLSIGFFEGAGPIFGFDSGVILSSGDVKLAEGPNDEIEATFAYANQSDDPDMNIFAPNSIFDVGGIEFDFIPVGSSVTFKYAFASEEYCEFVGTEFNDVFGFFVSGPGINGPFSNNAINVALVPGTDDFVAINSINHATNANLYIKNERLEEANECDVPFDQAFPELIEYDGMTTELEASFEVIPCETYHIRLLVADVGDDILDSGVFLATKTFDLNPDVKVTAVAEGNNQAIAVEACTGGSFVFRRPSGTLGQAIVVYFSINENSTAESGVDYAPLPDSIIIPANELTFTLPVEIFADQLIEDQETIILEMEFACDCIDPIAATLFIDDKQPVAVETEDVETCAEQSFTISPNVSGGVEPYSFLWENGSDGSSLSTSTDVPTTYSVTVTEFCGSTAVGNITAIPQPVPSAVLSGETDFCEGAESFLEINFEGSPPWAVQYSVDGTIETVADIFENPYLLPVNAPGVYTLTGFTDAFCFGNFSGTATVENTAGKLEYTATPSTCFQFADGAISWSVLGGSPPFTAQWSPSVNDPRSPSQLLAGNYAVTITDSLGCQIIDTVTISTNPTQSTDCKRFSLYVPNAFSPNDDGFNDDFRLYPSSDSNIALVKSMHIFNRWGGLVFEKKDFEANARIQLWDGTFKGKKMDAGVYVWQVVLELEDGTSELLAGDLTLVK